MTFMDARRVKMSYNEVKYIVKSLEVAMTRALITKNRKEAEVFKMLLEKYSEIKRSMEENRPHRQIRLNARKDFVALISEER